MSVDVFLFISFNFSYIDYRNVRAKYVEAWWKLVNWKFAEANYAASKL